MSPAEEFWMIVGMVIVTFGVRYPVMALSGRFRLSPGIEAALGFVPVAVLSAITVPMLIAPSGEIWLSVDNEYLLAGAVAAVVAAISRHLLLTIVIGMSIFLVLRFMLS